MIRLPQNIFKFVLINSNYIAASIRNYSKALALNLSPAETSKVLDFINQKDNSTTLKGINFTDARVFKVQKWKEAHGDFVNIEQLLMISGFSAKFVEKVCGVILNKYSNEGSTTQNTIQQAKAPKIIKDDFIPKAATKFMKNRVCTPPMNSSKCNSIKSFTSIHMTPTGVAWARFALNRTQNMTECAEVTHWEHYNLDMYKMHLIDIAQLYIRINKLIPPSDAYIMEESSIRINYQKGNQTNLPMQQAQAVALLTGLLSFRTANVNNASGSDADANVYFIARNISGRLYGIYVGYETISTKYIVKKILNPQTATVDAYIVDSVAESMKNANYTFDSELCRFYKESDLVEKELLGRALIMGTTFFRLCILSCSHSLSFAYSPMNYNLRNN